MCNIYACIACMYMYIHAMHYTGVSTHGENEAEIFIIANLVGEIIFRRIFKGEFSLPNLGGKKKCLVHMRHRLTGSENRGDISFMWEMSTKGYSKMSFKHLSGKKYFFGGNV